MKGTRRRTLIKYRCINGDIIDSEFSCGKAHHFMLMWCHDMENLAAFAHTHTQHPHPTPTPLLNWTTLTQGHDTSASSSWHSAAMRVLPQYSDNTAEYTQYRTTHQADVSWQIWSKSLISYPHLYWNSCWMIHFLWTMLSNKIPIWLFSDHEL